MPKVELECSDSVMVEKEKDRMENIAGGEELIAWCG
jgi:hypothetical protein